MQVVLYDIYKYMVDTAGMDASTGNPSLYDIYKYMVDTADRTVQSLYDI